MPDSDSICVGAVAGAFGVRGEVRLKSFCADAAAIADYAPLSDEAGRSYEVRLTRPVKNGFAARLSGVETREDAEALRGRRLYAPRARLPALPDDEFYHADLVGLEVVDPGGAPLGRVRAVHDFGAGDMLEIFGPRLGQPVMLPFTREAAPTVDLAAGRIVVDPPAGLLPDDAAPADAEGKERP
ncbi:MAG TPA: ribosome maturation factor RimM [Paracoccaceae bacterium]|nr:ribosome maturation factor RimM [Paracoccaceae bacterium]